MAITRASLGRGPAKVTFGGATLYAREDFVASHAPVFNPIKSSLHGSFDKSRKDLVIRTPLMLFGLWADLSVLFPSTILSPDIGASLFSGADSPLVIHAKNQDRITYHNSRITKVSDLYLGVDSELFTAAVEFTSLLRDNYDPETAAAYFTRDTAAYVTPAFATTNFKRVRFTGAWAGKTGFSAVVPQAGFNVSWQFDAQPVTVDGLGTVDMVVGDGGLTGTCRCIPIGPTQAQIDTAQAIAAAHGGLLGANGADLTLSGSGITVVLKKAAIVSSSTAFGTAALRVGELAWETTRGFTAGVPDAIATVA